MHLGTSIFELQFKINLRLQELGAAFLAEADNAISVAAEAIQYPASRSCR